MPWAVLGGSYIWRKTQPRLVQASEEFLLQVDMLAEAEELEVG